MHLASPRENVPFDPSLAGGVEAAREQCYHINHVAVMLRGRLRTGSGEGVGPQRTGRGAGQQRQVRVRGAGDLPGPLSLAAVRDTHSKGAGRRQELRGAEEVAELQGGGTSHLRRGRPVCRQENAQTLTTEPEEAQQGHGHFPLQGSGTADVSCEVPENSFSQRPRPQAASFSCTGPSSGPSAHLAQGGATCRGGTTFSSREGPGALPGPHVALVITLPLRSPSPCGHYWSLGPAPSLRQVPPGPRRQLPTDGRFWPWVDRLNPRGTDFSGHKHSGGPPLAPTQGRPLRALGPACLPWEAPRPREGPQGRGGKAA